MSRPPAHARRALAGLLAIASAALTAVGSADPYQIEVLVFARPTDLATPSDVVAHQPDCLDHAQSPSAPSAILGIPSSVGPEQFRLMNEDQALRRSGTGLQVLTHTAWQQDVSATGAGPWVRIGGQPGTGLAGCLRTRLTPVPQVQIELVHEAATGEVQALSGRVRIRPGDVHYFDHPGLGMLVRLDSLATAPGDAPVGGGDAPLTSPVGSPAPAPAAIAAPESTTAAPAVLEPPPPPPKKPFRW